MQQTGTSRITVWIRGRIAGNLESSSHASAVQRIERVRTSPALGKESLMPINSRMEAAHQPITTEANLDLIDWTARLTRADKRGRVDAAEPPILRKLGRSAQQWHRQ